MNEGKQMLSLFLLYVGGGRVSIFGRDAKPQRPALHAKGKIPSLAHAGFFKLFVATIPIDSWQPYRSIRSRYIY